MPSWTGFGAADLVSETSARVTTVTSVLAASFVVTVCAVVVVARAVLVTVPGSRAASTRTSRVTRALEPGVIVPSSQATGDVVVQVPWVGVTCSRVRPAGTASARVTPRASVAPVLATVTL
ncbi:hypothetical protein GCM10009714_34720 [Microlunatus capsulatus]